MPHAPAALEPAIVAAEARLHRLLGDPSRLMLLALLAAGERNVGDLAVAANISQATASHGLAKLRDAGLLCSRREAQYIFYSVVADHRDFARQVAQRCKNGRS